MTITIHSGIKTALGVLLLIVVLEALSRTLWRDEMVSLFSQGFDPEIGFIHKRNEILVKRLPARNIWPQSIPNPKSSDTVRVFVIGSSVSRGTREINYPFMLRDRYATKRLPTSGKHLELYNLSASGYGVRRKVALLEKVISLEPDLLIVHLDGSNEFEDEREWNTANQYKGFSNPAEWPMKLWSFRFIAQRRTEKLVWRYIPREARKGTIANDADLEIAATLNPEKQKVWRERLKQNIELMAQEATEASIPVIFLVRGVYDQDRSRAEGRIAPANFEDELSVFLATTVEGLRAKNVEMIRLGWVFGDQKLPVEEYALLFADSTHLREPGHRAVAEYIAAKVLSRL